MGAHFGSQSGSHSVAYPLFCDVFHHPLGVVVASPATAIAECVGVFVIWYGGGTMFAQFHDGVVVDGYGGVTISDSYFHE